MLSRIEPQPQCVTKTPTASCAKTLTWVAQSTTIPSDLVLSRNPFGRFACDLCLSDQINGTLLASKASAIATISFGDGVATVPKLTYATEAGFFFCLSSHARQPYSSSKSVADDGC
ncbi:hypothetical protein CISIN_1g033614mg [Citrus sinensis]|uniref:Uncharacterized protein n=1 Tax=Citrus sinensis TaxID=2711 RepID=A0A067EI61_CITSI|nr:hypothetical protein CISIN_1g033614mg [Citrus sinensis]